MTAKALKLAAEDADDLKVVASMLQDAVGKVGDIVFLPRQRRFAMVFNRFRWEDADKSRRGERVRAGLHFDGVLAVKQQKIRTRAADAVLSLLTVSFEAKDDGAGAVTLYFAGGGAIRLEVECLDAHLADLTDPWPAKAKPKHEV